jgi:hypothetical protein
MYNRILETIPGRKATHDDLQRKIAMQRREASRQPKVSGRDKLIAKGLIKPTQGA